MPTITTKKPAKKIESRYTVVTTEDGFLFEFCLADDAELFPLQKSNPGLTQCCGIILVAETTGFMGKYFRPYFGPFSMAHHVNFIKKFMRDPEYRSKFHKSGIHWDGSRTIRNDDIREISVISNDFSDCLEELKSSKQSKESKELEESKELNDSKESNKYEISDNSLENPVIMLHPKCGEMIATFNRMSPEELKKASLRKLKTFGLDGYSKMSEKNLEARIPVGIVESLKKDPMLVGTDYVQALRWVARGLSPDLAVRKILSDLEAV